MLRLLSAALLVTAFCGAACAADLPASLQGTALTVTADGIGKDGIISAEFAFCVPASVGHVQEGSDKNIGLSWSKGPDGTKSYAVIAVDTDVPTVFEDAGKEGKTLPATMKRRNFYHWVLFDIPANITTIPAGADSNALEKNGKSTLKTAYGTRGLNDYGPYFASNPERKGVYAGYDGPCPPWNDEQIHHYHFKVYALDTQSLGLTGEITGPQAEAALGKHILAQGEIMGTYTLNPALKK